VSRGALHRGVKRLGLVTPACGHPDKNGEIVEVHGDGGTPPYLVKFDDGKTRLIYPGPDAVIEHPASG
jgi:hypothetical protein